MENDIFSETEITKQEGTTLPISPEVQSLLRRWLKERDALENQINGVLQSLVVGRPGTWDLDETTSFMSRRPATFVGLTE